MTSTRSRLRPKGPVMSCGKRRRGEDEISLASATLAYPWQPDHTITRRTARIVREAYSVWYARMGPITHQLPADKVQSLFNEMQLYPTRAQVSEMLHCAKECADRNTASYLTFGEFCLFATELKRCYDKGIPRSNHLARLLERDGQEKKRQTRKMSKTLSKQEVFLGGSCNPTTWRHDIAIPLLKNLGITYYNPQVAEWSAELIEQEYLAKQSATVLFYVIDRQTRNIVGMIEAANFAGARRKLVLVIDSYKPGQTVGGELISSDEYEELNGGILMLQDLVERQGIPVFNNIPIAINCTAKVLREKLTVQDLTVTDMAQPVKMGHLQVGDKLIKLRQAFDALDSSRSGQISLTDVCMAYRLMTNRKLSVTELRNIVSGQTGNGESTTKVNFEEFCTIVAELKGGSNGVAEKWTLCGRPLRALPVNNTCLRDVFLAGDLADYTWALQLAIPFLKKNKLSYYTVNENQTGQKHVLDPSDAAAIDSSFLLLFNITSHTRALSLMTMAAHYIGLGCNVVLCVQHISEGSIFGTEKLSQDAVNDYNRGRVYLMDLARRDRIPVFQTIQEAIDCVIEKCTSR
uniref:EF-hand domain-containing protein n=2 Tax=Clastoptera arizonana TaxID=38151 RepID=A0A1B6BZG1_9HEMI